MWSQKYQLICANIYFNIGVFLNTRSKGENKKKEKKEEKEKEKGKRDERRKWEMGNERK